MHEYCRNMKLQNMKLPYSNIVHCIDFFILSERLTRDGNRKSLFDFIFYSFSSTICEYTWRRKQTKQAPSWKQGSILGGLWTLSYMPSIYANDIPTGKPGPPDGRAPGLICSFITEEIKSFWNVYYHFTYDSKDWELWWILSQVCLFDSPNWGLASFGAQGRPPPNVPQLITLN